MWPLGTFLNDNLNFQSDYLIKDVVCRPGASNRQTLSPVRLCTARQELVCSHLSFNLLQVIFLFLFSSMYCHALNRKMCEQ